uniref:Uncharacterized protein n=1 Tax=Molossus molossus TaxID=27622 RepID=A0A7J8BYE5_MOLMO|nr:hypothetical protein HJG59_010035 [Molossus molossus]
MSLPLVLHLSIHLPAPQGAAGPRATSYRMCRSPCSRRLGLEGAQTASVRTALMSSRLSPGQPPPAPLIEGSLWPRNGQRGLGPWPSSGLRARHLAGPNLLPIRDPLGASSLVRPILLWGLQPWATATQLQGCSRF